jgi:hypothetical protein
MNKSMVLPIALSLLTFTLAGCGGEDDGIYGSGNSNELEINHFERLNNDIARIETEYSDGERDIDVTNIKGSFNSSTINDLPVSTVLGKNFEGTLEDRYIEVKGRTVKRPIYETNSNKKLNYQTDYRTLDLSGKNASSYQKGSRPSNDRGIFTDLNNFISIPNSTSFPNGSVCYIPVTKSNESFFVFNDKNKTRYQALEDWIEVNEDRFGDNQKSSTTTVKVGRDNNDRAAEVKFFATNERPEYIYYGAEYDKSVFNADYINKDQQPPNEDFTLGVVDCTLVNDVAADFLEQKIKRYY